MFALLSAVAAAASPPPLRDALSGIFGSVSLTAWICLLLPQLIQNYKSQNAHGLSMAFLFVWLLGDVTNLAGALWTHLAPTAIALACYFCIADVVLISQCLYYNTKSARKARRSRSRRRISSTGGTENTEDEPLLAGRRSSSLGLPGSHRGHSRRREESNLDPLTRIITGEDDRPDSNPWLHNALSLLAVWVVGVSGYFFSYRIGVWDAAPKIPDPESPEAKEVVAIVGIALGYCSALCYLCARIPQIIKNYREKSCEGLALLFFLLSLTGNFSYGASLVAYSQESSYLVKALPWLLGSLGTMVEDCIIFAQFRIYAPRDEPKVNASGSRDEDGHGTAYGSA